MSSLKGLYAITDTTRHQGGALLRAVQEAIAGGVRVLQYRDKTSEPARRLDEASALAEYCRQQGVCFIVNDDLELALNSQADGVHLGGADGSIPAARNQLAKRAKNDLIIGASCYDQIQRAEQAALDGADYLAFGAMFTSRTKPNAPQASALLVTEAQQRLGLPVCAIGGISAENMAELSPARPDMIAVVSDLFSSADIRARARALHHQWQRLHLSH